jgi:hypothetical protein
MDWLISIGLIVYALVVFIFRRTLKIAFNKNIGFAVKNFIFVLVFMAPFSFLFGCWALYSSIKFSLNSELYVSQCIENSKNKNIEVVSVEKEGSTVFIKFLNKNNGKTFWCENGDGTAKNF